MARKIAKPIRSDWKTGYLVRPTINVNQTCVAAMVVVSNFVYPIKIIQKIARQPRSLRPVNQTVYALPIPKLAKLVQMDVEGTVQVPSQQPRLVKKIAATFPKNATLRPGPMVAAELAKEQKIAKSPTVTFLILCRCYQSVIYRLRVMI